MFLYCSMSMFSAAFEQSYAGARYLVEVYVGTQSALAAKLPALEDIMTMRGWSDS